MPVRALVRSRTWGSLILSVVVVVRAVLCYSGGGVDWCAHAAGGFCTQLPGLMGYNKI